MHWGRGSFALVLLLLLLIMTVIMLNVIRRTARKRERDMDDARGGKPSQGTPKDKRLGANKPSSSKGGKSKGSGKGK